MILTKENYHSKEARKIYMSSSRYLDWVGCPARPGCEARALAMRNGDWEESPSPAMLVSGYVDAYFAGDMEAFKENNPDIFKKDGTLKANYVHMDTIIKRIERDGFFMEYIAGEKQVIFNDYFFDMEWSCMVDFYINHIAIVDLKIMQDLRKTFYDPTGPKRLEFVRYYGYDAQAAIYQRIVYRYAKKYLPFIIAAASKEAVPDIEIIGFDEETLKEATFKIEINTVLIKEVLDGKREPSKCGVCDYCKETKVLTRAIHYEELTK